MVAPLGTNTITCTFLHQASFLAYALADSPPLDWRSGGKAIAKRIRTVRTAEHLHRKCIVPPEDDIEDDPAALHEALTGVPLPAAWQLAAPPCRECEMGIANPSLNIANRIPRRRANNQAIPEQRLSPVARGKFHPGQAIAALYGTRQRALWPSNATGWWPKPIPVAGAKANCKWGLTQCRSCMTWRAALLAEESITKGTTLTVPFSDDPVLGGEELPHLEIYFDGSVSTRDGRKHGGMAAVVLGPAKNSGQRTVIASRSVALPEVTDSTATEGHAGSLAAQLASDTIAKLADTWNTPCNVRFCGDNPTIIGLCTGLTTTRRAHIRIATDNAIRHSRTNFLTTTSVHIPRAYNRAHTAALAASRAACAPTCSRDPFTVTDFST